MQEQKWISVEDHLPDMYLVHCDDDVGGIWLQSLEALAWDGEALRIAYAVFDSKLTWVTEGGDSFEAKYWYPLPTVPKEVRENG